MHLAFFPLILTWIISIIRSGIYAYRLFKETTNNHPVWPTIMFPIMLLLSPYLLLEGYFIYNMFFTNVGINVLYGDNLAERIAAEQSYLKELREMYGKEFKIKKTYYSRGLTSNKYYNFEAYPIDNPNLIFKDFAYYEIVLTQLSMDECKPLLNNLYRKKYNFITTVDYWRITGREGYKHTGKDAYDYLRNRYSNKIPLYLSLNVISDLMEENRDEELTKILSIIEFIKNRKLASLNLKINYFDQLKLKKKGIEHIPSN